MDISLHGETEHSFINTSTVSMTDILIDLTSYKMIQTKIITSMW